MRIGNWAMLLGIVLSTVCVRGQAEHVSETATRAGSAARTLTHEQVLHRMAKLYSERTSLLEIKAVVETVYGQLDKDKPNFETAIQKSGLALSKDEAAKIHHLAMMSLIPSAPAAPRQSILRFKGKYYLATVNAKGQLVVSRDIRFLNKANGSETVDLAKAFAPDDVFPGGKKFKDLPQKAEVFPFTDALTASVDKKTYELSHPSLGFLASSHFKDEKFQWTRISSTQNKIQMGGE